MQFQIKGHYTKPKQTIQLTTNSFEYVEYTLLHNIYSKNTIVGIDPGTTHVGLALFYNNVCWTWEVTKTREPDAPSRINFFTEMLAYATAGMSNINFFVEGASYADRYRQVELEDIRAATVCFAKSVNSSVKIVPPNTIRKDVFGSAKIKNPWKDILPDNAAAALGCMLYGVK